MFESFTAGAERALRRASSVARRRGGGLGGALDWLAALALEAESRAAELMAEFGVPTSRLRDVIGPVPWADEAEAAARQEGDAGESEPLPGSAALRQVLGEAANQARGLD